MNGLDAATSTSSTMLVDIELRCVLSGFLAKLSRELDIDVFAGLDVFYEPWTAACVTARRMQKFPLHFKFPVMCEGNLIRWGSPVRTVEWAVRAVHRPQHGTKTSTGCSRLPCSKNCAAAGGFHPHRRKPAQQGLAH
eukprot:4149860-Amphidinium_carterae.1